MQEQPLREQPGQRAAVVTAHCGAMCAMTLLAIGRWRKGVLWPAMWAIHMIVAFCYVLAVSVEDYLRDLIDVFKVSTRVYICLILVYTSKTAIAIVLASYLVIVYFILQYLWYKMIVWLVVSFFFFLSDLLYCEITHWIHWYRPWPAEEAPNAMERVAHLRTASGRCPAQFYPAVICNGDALDDPFWPDHASILHCAEVRWHCMVWREVILWRVNLLNGVQRELASFHIVNPLYECLHEPFDASDDRQIKCFQSHGVIFILDLDGNDPDTLTIYDTRFGKSTMYDELYKLRLGRLSTTFLFIQLRRRLFDSTGHLEGWQMQLFSSHYEWADDASSKVCLSDELYDLREKIAQVSSEEIAFGKFGPGFPELTTFRTNDGSFGVETSGQQHAAMVFDLIHNRYRYYATMDIVKQAYSQIWRLDDGPVFLNERECVQLLPNGCIYRKAFHPATMKYIAAKSFFRFNDGRLNRMTAAQFLRITGVDMTGQFPDQTNSSHFVWVHLDE